MIYECPQCQMPQAAGVTLCPQCHAEFDGPVPDDAIVPLVETAPAEANPAEANPAETLPLEASPVAAPLLEPVTVESGPGPMPLDLPPMAEEALSAEEAPPPGTVSPLVAPDTQTYLTPPSYTPPPYTPPVSGITETPYAPPPAPPLGGLTRALLIAFPIVLVLVLGGVYFANTLNTDTDTAPEMVAVARPQAPTPAAPPADVAPVTMQGGSNTNDGSDPRVKLLAGRWVSKSDDFYVFNSDGTGSRGSTVKSQAEQSFLWGLVQNRLMLYGAKNETLRFNTGPDNDTVFLGPQIGHYVQYSRAKSQ